MLAVWVGLVLLILGCFLAYVRFRQIKDKYFYPEEDPCFFAMVVIAVLGLWLVVLASFGKIIDYIQTLAL